MLTLVQAIARQEGFDKVGTRAQRNNNPGNINFGPFAAAHGAAGSDDKGYAVFASPDAGFAALRALLGTSRYRGRTLEDVLSVYCPPTGDPRGDNDTLSYIQHVCEWTGMTPNTIIDAYISTPDAGDQKAV